MSSGKERKTICNVQMFAANSRHIQLYMSNFDAKHATMIISYTNLAYIIMRMIIIRKSLNVHLLLLYCRERLKRIKCWLKLRSPLWKEERQEYFRRCICLCYRNLYKLLKHKKGSRKLKLPNRISVKVLFLKLLYVWCFSLQFSYTLFSAFFTKN